MAGGVFQAIAGFIGELAKVHLPAVGGQTQHVDVGARAPNFFLATFKHHHLDGRVLKTDAVDGVMQFDVYTQVIAVELEFVARLDAAVFVDVEFEFCNITFNKQRPVLVLGRVGGKADQLALLAANGLFEQKGL